LNPRPFRRLLRMLVLPFRGLQSVPPSLLSRRPGEERLSLNVADFREVNSAPPALSRFFCNRRLSASTHLLFSPFPSPVVSLILIGIFTKDSRLYSSSNMFSLSAILGCPFLCFVTRDAPPICAIQLAGVYNIRSSFRPRAPHSISLSRRSTLSLSPPFF